MKIDNVIKNPLLRYKLDPGEPGMATPTPASRSIAKVATHEAANLRRFKKEALEDGGIVVYSSIFLNLSYQGAFLAATSGKSKALIVMPAEKNVKKDPEKIQPEIGNNAEDHSGGISQIIENPGNMIRKYNEKGVPVISDGEIDAGSVKKIIDELELEKTNLINQLKSKEQSGKIDGKEDYYLKGRIEKIQSRIKALNMAAEIEKQKKITDIMLESGNIAAKLLGLKYNGKNNEDLTGAIINTYA